MPPHSTFPLTFISLEYGRGETFDAHGKTFASPAEHRKALKMATNEHDILQQIELQKALVPLWQGDLGTGRAELAGVFRKAAEAKDRMAEFEIDYAWRSSRARRKSRGELGWPTWKHASPTFPRTNHRRTGNHEICAPSFAKKSAWRWSAQGE